MPTQLSVHSSVAAALVSIVAAAGGHLAATAAPRADQFVSTQAPGPGGAPPTPGAPATSPSSAPQGSGVITGVVVDGTTGAPVPGAIVALGPGGRSAAVPSRQISDGQGRFAFVGVPPSARLVISASRPGYIADDAATFAPPTELSLADGQWLNQVRVVLRKLAAMGGTITDERGDPVVGVMVRAYARVQIAGQDHLASSSSTMTDDRGQYRLSNLLPGRYLVAVPSVQASIPASTPDARIANVPEAQLSAAEATGTAAGFSAIEVDDTTRLVTGPYPTPPPSAGSAVLAYPMVFHPTAAALTEATTITLQFGDARTDVNVGISPVGTATVRGRVQGGPAARGSLTVRLVAAGLDELGIGSETATALVDADGSFRFARVPFGSYTLSPGAVLGEYRVGPMNVGELGRFRFPGIGPSGSMSSGVDGYPGVSFSQSTMGTSPVFGDRIALNVGPSGVQDIVLTLREGITISGNVRVEIDSSSPSPAPAAFIGIRAEPADGGTRASGRSSPADPNDPERPFRLQNMAPGRYVIRPEGSAWRVKSVLAGGREYRDTPLEATDSLSDVVVTLTSESATVTGSVLNDRGAPAPGVLVGVFPVDRAGWSDFGQSSPRMRAAIATDAGRYRIGLLPAGDYYVTVIPDRRRDDWRSRAFFESVASSASRISVDWGQTRDQALRVEAR